MSLSEEQNRRRYNGVVYTPTDVASALTTKTLLLFDGKHPRVLEPSVGDGVFLSCLSDSKNQVENISCVDIDDVQISILTEQYPNTDFYLQDFLDFASSSLDGSFDIIIGNPPYIRSHNFSPEFAENVTNLAKQNSCSRSIIKNAWAAFIIASERLLSENGVLSFVVPYELLNVKYGRDLQRFLSSRFESISIYVPQSKAFPHIEQDAVAVVAQKTLNPEKPGVTIEHVRDLILLSPISSHSVNYADSVQVSSQLKSGLLSPEANALIAKLRRNLPTVSQYCSNAAGTVTGANDFFILSSEEVSKFDAENWVSPVLRKASFLPKGPVFDQSAFDEIATDKKCYLLNLGHSPRESLPIALQRYIEEGEQQEISDRYKCSRRTPWYRVPIVPVSEGFFFKRAHSFPRLCINEAGTLVTDTAYQIWVNEGYSIQDLCFSFYNTLTVLFSEIEGRFYGGGVLEVTPNEFRSLPFVAQKPSKSEFEDFLTLFPSVSDLSANQFSQSDLRLKSEIQLTDTDLALLQSSTTILRQHRMNHSC